MLRNSVTHLIALLLGMTLAWLAMPLWRGIVINWNQDAYGELVYKCDTAMRDQFMARQDVSTAPSPESEQRLAAAEIGLLDCQDYDLFQKRLMQLGLREEELSQMRLAAVEARASDLAEVIDTHEIRY